MDFIGTGKRLSTGDVGEIARQFNLETAVVLAWMEVEANGSGWDNRNRPKILFEPHVLYRNLAGQQRTAAVAQGLAYAKWGTKPYPKSFDARYQQVERAQKINFEAGLKAASWGVGQILGENATSLGYGLPSNMVREFMKGEYEQVLGIMAFLRVNNVLPLLRNRDFTKAAAWEPAVRIYNGSGYAKHQYHIRAAAAYVKHKRKEGTVIVAPTVLRMNTRGEAVMALQRDLLALGYQPGPADGIFGASTRDAVKAFQAANSLTADGIAGPATLLQLANARTGSEIDHSPEPPEFIRDLDAEVVARLGSVRQSMADTDAELGAIIKLIEGSK